MIEALEAVDHLAARAGAHPPPMHPGGEHSRGVVAVIVGAVTKARKGALADAEMIGSNALGHPLRSGH